LESIFGSSDDSIMPVMAGCSPLRAYFPGLQPDGVRYFLEDGVIDKCPRGAARSSATLPEVEPPYDAGSIPILSFTAAAIRCVPPR
jgi:hypothetical protein